MFRTILAILGMTVLIALALIGMGYAIEAYRGKVISLWVLLIITNIIPPFTACIAYFVFSSVRSFKQ